MTTPALSRFLSIATVGATLTTAACGGASSAPAPVAPEATVREFLGAVRTGSLRTMSELWGTSRGPAARSMNPTELEQRLTVMRIYLEHEQFEFLPEERFVAARGKQVVRVRLTRRGCAPVVPFTLVRYREGWLVSEVDLAAAGNPQRSCVRPG